MHYLVVGVLWGAYAAARNHRLHPEVESYKHALTFITNCIIWPFCMVIATIAEVCGEDTIVEAVNRRCKRS